jgi:hypothetical protein
MKRGVKSKFTQNDLARIQDLSEQGFSQTDIAAVMSCSQQSVSRHLAKLAANADRPESDVIADDPEGYLRSVGPLKALRLCGPAQHDQELRETLLKAYRGIYG